MSLKGSFLRDNGAMQESYVGKSSSSQQGVVARLGWAMLQHQKAIRIVQWTMVGLYAFLLIAPFFQPAPGRGAHILNHLWLFAQFLFWGVGWPLIMLSMMLVGRAWCGLFCPDGTLTEAISRHGRHGSIPRWMRWRGWPCAMLVGTTVYGQLVGVYDFHTATLLLLGLPTVGAMLTGYLYGSDRRIWCMYLCPANGVFNLIARVAPVHFHVDEQQWKQFQGRPSRVVCPPLVDIQRMKSTSECHACGRCIGYRDAVEMALRPPHREILATASGRLKTAEIVTLLFGILGVCTAAMQWRSSLAFAVMKSWIAAALPSGALAWLQEGSAPWWLLANYPEAGVVFSLFDGLCVLFFLLGGGALLALVIGGLMWLAAHLANEPELSWQRLALALIPVAGMGLVLGLSVFTVTHLRQEGLTLAWVLFVRAALLGFAGFFSAWLGWKMLVMRLSIRKLLAQAVFLLPVGLACLVWAESIFV